MRNTAFWKAIDLLSQPATWFAMGCLLLNDQLLRRLWPSWWTGKLGDLAWLYFIPFACAALLAVLFPPRLPRQRKIVAWLAFALPTGIFILSKTLPAFHAWTVDLAEATFGFPVAWRRDPSDLIALAAVVASAWRWRTQPDPFPQRPVRGWIALPLAVLLTLANSGAPELGINCLGIQDGQLVASATYTRYTGAQGGESWQSEGNGAGSISCTKNAPENLLADPLDPELQYRYQPGVAIERSTDGGRVWQVVYPLAPTSEAEQVFYERRGYNGQFNPGPLDALVDPASGNVLFAMGYEGILLYKPAEDRWEWVPVGNYRHAELGPPDYLEEIFSLILGELLLAIAFGILAANMLGLRFRSSKARAILISLAWLLWGLPAFLFPPALTYGTYGTGLLTILTLAAGLLVIPLGLETVFVTAKERPRLLPYFALWAAGSAILFFLPFVLWSTNSLPAYTWAFYLALALGFAVLLAGYRWVKTLPLSAAPSGARAAPGPDLQNLALGAFLLVAVLLTLLRFFVFV